MMNDVPWYLVFYLVELNMYNSKTSLYVIKFVSDLRQVGGFLPGYSGFLKYNFDRHDITEILLKVALNTNPLVPFLHIILTQC